MMGLKLDSSYQSDSFATYIVALGTQVNTTDPSPFNLNVPPQINNI